MDDARLIDSRELHKRLSDLSERWYRAKKFGVAQGLAMAIEEVCNTDTIDPIRAAGGCRCGNCKYWKREVNTPDRQLVDWGFCEKFLDSDSEEEINTVEKDFCSYGEPREAQDDG